MLAADLRSFTDPADVLDGFDLRTAVVTCGLEVIHEHGDELGPLQELRYVSYLEHDPRMRQVQACGQLLRHQAWLRIAPAEQVRLNPDWQEEMKETNFYPTSAIDDPDVPLAQWETLLLPYSPDSYL